MPDNEKFSVPPNEGAAEPANNPHSEMDAAIEQSNGQKIPFLDSMEERGF